MPTYPAQIVRLEVQFQSAPAVPPVDAVTGNAPAAYRGAAVRFDLGIFCQDGSSLDLSNYTFLELDILPPVAIAPPPAGTYNYGAYTANPFPNLPPAPIVWVTLPNNQLTSNIDFDAWRAGTQKQASFLFSAVQMAQLDLGGLPTAPFQLVLSGLTSDGARIVLASASLFMGESGAQGIYLPNNLAPLDVPDPTILYIGPNQQMPFSLPITVEGTVVIDGGVLVQS